MSRGWTTLDRAAWKAYAAPAGTCGAWFLAPGPPAAYHHKGQRWYQAPCAANNVDVCISDRVSMVEELLICSDGVRDKLAQYWWLETWWPGQVRQAASAVLLSGSTACLPERYARQWLPIWLGCCGLFTSNPQSQSAPLCEDCLVPAYFTDIIGRL